MQVDHRVRGTLAAAVTPITGIAGTIDGDGIGAVVDFYARSGLDGILALGTTGEGILFSLDERRFAADEYVTSAHHRLAVVVHCGAQTTHDTVVLAEHAAAHEAAGVAVIPPPYFALDAEAIWRHLDAAAHACAPLPFYIYEFAARSGYAVPIEVVERLRSSAPNLAGLKVSDSPFDKVLPYLLPGLDIFVGAEGLIAQGMASGAAGAVSGLAGALPELTIDAVASRSAEASARAARVRSLIEPFPFQSALKFILQRRGVAIEDAVRAPLRTLDDTQRDAVRALLDDPAGEIAGLLAS
jgi:dihydrodipicolinate synthase/N-acetylneuraminate lyase